jgi:poly-gamma-glutamate synthesis protein (capsule biosynthesis protein)
MRLSKGRVIATQTAIIALLLIPHVAGAADKKPIRLVLTGQSLLQADIRTETPTAIETIKPLLKGDVVVTNFETTIAKPGDDLSPFDLKVRCVTPPEGLDVLRDLGVNLVGASNNHSFDIKMLGLLNTVHETRARKLATAGIGMNLKEAAGPAYLKTPKGTVALVAAASGQTVYGGMAEASKPGFNEIRMVNEKPGVDAGQPNPEDAARMLANVREAAKKADLVISYMHNHSYDPDFRDMFREELPERFIPPKWIKKWAHDQIDAGADIVSFDGAPVLQGVEIYKGKPILYGMGNFIFNLPSWVDFFGPVVFESAVAHVDFEGKTLKSITYHPIVLNFFGRGEGKTALATRGLPKPAGERSRFILARLVNLSRDLGTTVEVNGDVGVVKIPNATP